MTSCSIIWAWHLDDIDFTDGHVDVEVVNAEHFRIGREIAEAKPGAFFIDGAGAACELHRLPCPPSFDPDGKPF